jgi:hypothetical protein
MQSDTNSTSFKKYSRYNTGLRNCGQYFRTPVFAILLTVFSLAVNAQSNDLYIGTATADISPKLPVALMGQFALRVANIAETPLFASILVIESRHGKNTEDATIFVSCDLVVIPSVLINMVREEMARRIPGLDVSKIVLNATHTHTSPVLENGFYRIPKEGITQVDDYLKLFTQQVSDGIVKAWKARSAGGTMTWGLGSAVIAYNRRAVYTPGTGTKMYGKTDLPEFRNLEGYEDHGINSLFIWNKAGKLIAIAIDVPCPSQEVESGVTVHADFWHPVREKLKEKYGQDLCVVAWTGAAGDQSPHLMYRKAAEERMVALTKKPRIDQIATRITNAVSETYEYVKDDRHTNVTFGHKVDTLNLPMRLITLTEYNDAKSLVEKYAALMESDPKAADDANGRLVWNSGVLKRYEDQKNDPKPMYKSEIHVLRIGDIAVCTNQFELFTDFGIRMQARSKALQTFVVQLAGPGSYLPTEKAMAGGGYSAVCQSNLIGPDGGQILVDRTVELMDQLWLK